MDKIDDREIDYPEVRERGKNLMFSRNLSFPHNLVENCILLENAGRVRAGPAWPDVIPILRILSDSPLKVRLDKFTLWALPDLMRPRNG